MAATLRIKVYTGTTAATENPDAAPGTNAANFNFMSTDAYDSTGTTYQTNPIAIPSSGSAYSYERWIRMHFSGTFTTVTNMRFYRSSGNLSDTALVINGGIVTAAATPVNTPSTVATTAIPTTAGAALDATPTGGLTAAGYSRYIVLQLAVPSTVVLPSEVGTITYTLSFDET